MAIAGYRALVRISGDPVAFTGEPTTILTPNTVYQITEPTRRILDRTSAITVHVDGEIADPSTYSLNRLNGTITFNTVQGAGVVTVDGSFLTLANAAECREYSYSLSADNIDNTAFGSTFMTRAQGGRDVTGSLGSWYVDTAFSEQLLSGNPVVLEFYSDASQAPDLRVWALLSSNEIGAGDGLLDNSIDWEATDDADGRSISVA